MEIEVVIDVGRYFGTVVLIALLLHPKFSKKEEPSSRPVTLGIITLSLLLAALNLPLFLIRGEIAYFLLALGNVIIAGYETHMMGVNGTEKEAEGNKKQTFSA